MSRTYHNLDLAIRGTAQWLHDTGYKIRTEKWQGRETKPEHEMIESLNVSLSAPMPQKIVTLAELVRPNLPWADEHFKERVGGKPLNPGDQYKNWPYYKHNPANDIHRKDKQFTHTYMERIWPKQANGGPGRDGLGEDHVGIRYAYGDLADVVRLLAEEPHTRQAFLPIWFPEDTGVSHGGRVPCTIGYHFIMRDGWLHVVYYIRSCDFFRHFRDDIYLCIRMVQWLLEQNKPCEAWRDVKPGIFTMHITSLHAFAVEKPLLLK